MSPPARRHAAAAGLALALPACAASVDGRASRPDATVDAPPAADASTADVPARRRERCNRVDDDGDGKVDEGCPIRLTRAAGDDVLPSLDGRRLAWSSPDGLRVRDLPDGPERRLPIRCVYPSVSGRRLACVREGAYVVYDLDDGREVEIAPPPASYLQVATVEGDLIAWSQNQAGTEEDREVYVHDLATGRTTQVARDPAIQEFPALEGRTMVWQDDRHGHHTVGLLHLYDLYAWEVGSAAPPRRLTARSGDWQVGAPVAVDGGRVLTNESQGPFERGMGPRRCQAALYDVATGARTALTPLDAACDRAWDLSGRWVVMERDPDGASDLYLLRVGTGARYAITDYGRRSTAAELEGDLLVWVDDRNDDWDLYMMDVSDVEAGDLSPEGVTP